MSTPLAILHGDFGRIVLLHLNQSMVKHAHRHCHLIFKIGGPDVLFGINQKEHLLTNEDALVINAWEPHFYHHRCNDEPITLLTFYFDPLWLKQIDRCLLLSGHPKFFSSPFYPISHKLNILKEETIGCLLDFSIPRKDTINQLMMDMFLEITNIVKPQTYLHPAGLYGELGYDSRIRFIINKVIQQEGQSICLNELAQSVGLSRSQFFKLFGRSTGLSPATFVNMLRMESCLTNVEKLDISIQDIAEQMGYFPAGNFTRFFLNQQGLTPSSYRKTVMTAQ